MSKQLEVKLVLVLTCLFALLKPIYIFGAISSNAQNDPYPIYSTLDPHMFLYTFCKQTIKGLTPDRTHQEWFNVSISPFGQNARCGRKGFLACNTNNDSVGQVELGDMGGPWDMITLLFGPLPQGQSLPSTLVDARSCLFPTVPLGVPIDDPNAVDPAQQFGFFTIPLEYRKRGMRFDFLFQILCDFGLTLRTGFVQNVQNVKNFTNLTDSSTFIDPCNNNPNLTKANVDCVLMNPLKDIAAQIHLDISGFHCFSIEDIRFGGYWRHAYLINEERPTWPSFLIIPFFELEGSAAVSKEPMRNKAFGITFGNRGHNALGFSAGLDVDFTETIEIGVEGGITHFFRRDFCNVPIPNNRFQSGIYPFQTDVNVQPAHNVHFAGIMNAYQFLDRLSFFFQYVLVMHREDCIHLKHPDPAFLPGVLEKQSGWSVQVANIAFNYDISPNVSLGFLWQAPLSQRNAYRSTTVMFSFNATY